MHIDFGFQFHDGFVGSAEAEAFIPKDEEINEIIGSVVFKSDHASFQKTDDLSELVPALCWQSQEALQKGESFQVDLMTDFGWIRFVPNGATTEVLDENDQSAIFPTAALQRELLDCGLRFISFMDKMEEKGERWKGTGENLRAFAAESMKALDLAQLDDLTAALVNDTLLVAEA